MTPLPTIRALLTLALLTMTLAVQAVTCTDATIPPTNPDNAYTDHGDGTVTDTRSGLMWQRCSAGQSWNGSTCTGGATSHTWDAALAQASNSRVGSYDDWRLPNVNELVSLVERCRINPSINDTVFPATSSSLFWSGSPNASNSLNAWHVYFDHGYSSYDGGSVDGFLVRLVRGGQSFASFAGNASGSALSVRFAPEAETLADGSYQIGSTVKRWGFVNGDTAISGLKAVRVSADAGLNIGVSEVALGNVAAGATFAVDVPVNPQRGGAALLSSVWKLVDGSGKDVAISNSASGTFWMKLRTNRPPVFSPLQLSAIGGPVNTLLRMPLRVSDADGDLRGGGLSIVSGGGSAIAMTISGYDGSLVSDGAWEGSFPSAGVHPVTMRVHDDVESTEFTFYVVVTDGGGLASFFADLPANTNPDSVYASAHYLAGKGITLGCGNNGAGDRIYCPAQTATQAEALKMLLLAAQARGRISLLPADARLPNLSGADFDASWAAPYAINAERLGLIAKAEDWVPNAPLDRETAARWVARLLGLEVPTALLKAMGLEAQFVFSDAAAFSSPAAYDAARAAAFFRYLGSLNADFLPAATLTRGELAVLTARLLRSPGLDGLTLQGTTLGSRFGLDLPVITHGQTLRVTGVQGLLANDILLDGTTVKEEWMTPAGDRVNIAVALDTGTSLGAVRKVSALAASPLTLDTNTLPMKAPGLVTLVVLLVNAHPDHPAGTVGVASAKFVQVAVDFPDRDGDGIRDDLDPWPDNPAASADANGNGIPDYLDLAYGLAGRLASEPVTVGGTPTTLGQVALSNPDALLALTSVSLPGAPLAVAATPGSGQVTLSFSPPASDGGGLIRRYTAACQSSDGGVAGVGVGSGAPLTVSGLTSGKTYTCAVQAVNGVGTGPASAVSNAVSPTAPPPVQTTVQLPKGWNLVGNGSQGVIDVVSQFGDPSRVISVWTWASATSQWAYYSPLQADGGAAHAASSGYRLLTSIAPGEGYWVNVGADAGLPVPIESGTAVAAASHQTLGSGWHLVAVGPSTTPADLNTAIAAEPPAQGQIANGLVTLWAWDSVKKQWLFWAPSLEALGGTALRDYQTQKGYLDFGVENKMLKDGAGFWIKRP